MAVVEIKRQMRVATRAWRKLLRRRIKPRVALKLLLRSCWKLTHAMSLLALLVVGGGIVATVMVSTRVIFKLRGLTSRS